MDAWRVQLICLFVYAFLIQGKGNVSFYRSDDVPGYETRYTELQVNFNLGVFGQTGDLNYDENKALCRTLHSTFRSMNLGRRKSEDLIINVDHFSFANADSFQLRYLVNDTYFTKDGSPIFLYTGNEGDIWTFANNTGLLMEMTPRFGAMVVFAEHRYYGQSLPYGEDSFKDPAHIGYLTSAQALADFAVLITQLKGTIPGAANSPVFAFGGSYGGMLAAWIRMKYPHLVAGSLASAASIFQYPGITDCEAYSHVATRTFRRSGVEGCTESIRGLWDVIQDMGKTEAGRQQLTAIFHLCEPLTANDMKTLVNWLYNLFMNYALLDYPYPTDFLGPLPAWPVKAACQLITNHENIVYGVAAAANLYFNSSGQTACLNISQPYYGGVAWQYQICTEQFEPLCSDGVNDMFPLIPWDLEAISEACYERWKVRPRPHWAVTEFWGWNISAASNIIFSNGDLDPWSAGCVLKSLSDSLVAIVMEDAAHHLDLRPSNPADPPSVVKARAQEAMIIEKWIQEYHAAK